MFLRPKKVPFRDKKCMKFQSGKCWKSQFPNFVYELTSVLGSSSRSTWMENTSLKTTGDLRPE